ncbi:SulP family inorganic anion transporter [Streptomyces sporangiiformans]|uniref:SulP family inorganic anion transporter n=1 Tax=Streptomyces sporangiiformans TaxID=2315329 RepID=UPI001F098BA4|nr:SulP family inorganic anion transporter [Streptomyces sporangiiformans]
MSGTHRRHARGRGAGPDGAGRTVRVDATGPHQTAPASHDAWATPGPQDEWAAPPHHQDEWPASPGPPRHDAWATPPHPSEQPHPTAHAPQAYNDPDPLTDPTDPTGPKPPKTSKSPLAANLLKGAKGAKGAKSSNAPKADLATEITASLVVFLVALPLCIGVAVASGVPAELGIISGVIGGLVVGAQRGSTLQVSGPAAGLAALVAETVMDLGVAQLGVIVLFSGILQIILGLVKLGRFFQAISLAVVQGMLAGIGLPLMFSQAYPAADAKAPGTPLENMAGVPGLLADTVSNPQAMIAAGLGILTVVLSFMWKKVPGPIKKIPAALVAVGIGIAVAALPGVNVKTLQVGNLLASVDVPGAEQFAGLADPAVITAILTFTVIASAESLFTAAAVDRMHDGPRTRYNPELIAQGAGNTVAGVLGALPITAVVARSSANVQAGAKTRMSRTLHGLWLLAFALLLPQVLALIPISVLAGVLIHSGWKLFAPEEFPKMWRQDRGEFAVMSITTLVIVLTALLEGVLVGLAAGIILAALRMSQTVIKQHIEDDTAKVVMAGNATFLRLPQVIEALEGAAESGKPRIRLDLKGVTHLDHACRNQVEEFVTQQRGKGLRVELLMPGPAKPIATDTKAPTAPESSPTYRADTPLPQRSPTSPTPGPTAEWFYLDTRPMPEEYAESYTSR